MWHAMLAGSADLHERVLEGRAALGARVRGRTVLLSGASDGADTLFGALALRQGHEVVHFLGPQNVPSAAARDGQPDTLYPLSEQALQCEQVNEIVGAIHRVRHPDVSVEAFEAEWRDSRRNVFQVQSADAVYAVAYRSAPAADTPALDIGGGTGWACQCYVNRFKPEGSADPAACRLYLYDDGAPGWSGCLKDPRTHRR